MSRRSRNNKKNITKLKLKNSTRVFLVILSLVIFAISSTKFFESLSVKNSEKVETQVYTYTNDYNLNYSVNIIKNNFITDETLPSGQTYVSDLIDFLDMNIKYKYTASDENVVNYNYKIDAVVGASYTNNGKEYGVWNKVYNLKDVTSEKSNGNILIDENINVDYKKYHQEVKNFEQSMGMSLDAFLYVRLTVNTSTIVNHQELKNSYVSNFSITLGDKIAIVDGKNQDTKINSIKQHNTVEQTNIDISKLIISAITMVVSLYTIYYVRFKTKKFNTIKNKFKFELNRILKSCQDRIVIVKNQVECEEDNIIDVNDFGELIKLSEELYKPILCWISDNISNEEAWFSVISNKITYRFILKK